MKNRENSSMERRDFIKTGLAAGALCCGSLGVLGTLQACSSLSEASVPGSYAANSEALTARHWGLVVDVQMLNDSADFEAIQEACHRNHNVPTIDDPKNEVKWIWQDSFEHCFEELENEFIPARIKELGFPVLCNHCEEPVCVRVCPTEATFKRPDGIVSMDYHRCIGCRFCMTACPYNARSLNFFDPHQYLGSISPHYPPRDKGIVEKCNFCVERLEEGLPPYCVEASQGSFVFGDLDDPDSEVREALEGAFSIRRLAELGTGPSVYYLLGDGDSVA